MMRNASSYLTAAENIVGRGLDVEVPEDPNGLIFSLLRTVQGQAAALAHLGPQLHRRHHESVDATCSPLTGGPTYREERLPTGEDDPAFRLC